MNAADALKFVLEFIFDWSEVELEYICDIIAN
jgi:hypothetical protein